MVVVDKQPADAVLGKLATPFGLKEYQGEAPWATAWRQKMRLSLDRAALSGSQESSPKISAAVATEVSAAQEPLLRPTLSERLEAVAKGRQASVADDCSGVAAYAPVAKRPHARIPSILDIGLEGEDSALISDILAEYGTSALYADALYDSDAESTVSSLKESLKARGSTKDAARGESKGGSKGEPKIGRGLSETCRHNMSYGILSQIDTSEDAGESIEEQVRAMIGQSADTAGIDGTSTAALVQVLAPQIEALAKRLQASEHKCQELARSNEL